MAFTQSRPGEWVEVIQLHFAQDEVVFANIGVLFLCHAQSDLMSDTTPSSYTVLDQVVAEDLVDCLMFEDEGRAPGMATAAGRLFLGISRSDPFTLASYAAKRRDQTGPTD